MAPNDVLQCFYENHPLPCTISLPTVVHIFAQNLIDARLPTLAFLAISVEHVSVEPKSLVDFPIGLRGAPASSPKRISSLGTEHCVYCVKRWKSALDLIARPFRVFVIQPRRRVALFLRHSISPLVCSPCGS